MVWHQHQFNSFYIDDLGEIPHLSSIFNSNNNNKIVINDLYSYIPNMSIKHNRWLPLDVMVFQSIPCMRPMWKWPLGNLLYVLNNRSGLSSFFMFFAVGSVVVVFFVICAIWTKQKQSRWVVGPNEWTTGGNALAWKQALRHSKFNWILLFLF